MFLPASAELNIGGALTLTDCRGVRCFAKDTVEADGCTWDVFWHGVRTHRIGGTIGEGGASVGTKFRLVMAYATATASGCEQTDCWSDVSAVSDVVLACDDDRCVAP